MVIKEINGCTLWHHSKNSIIKIDDKEYLQNTSNKPSGFWFSFCNSNGKDSWEEYCRAHKFMTHNLANKVQIQLNFPLLDEMLYISSKYDVFNIENEYGKVISPKYMKKITHIDWSRVSETYSGIIVYEETPNCLKSLGFGNIHPTPLSNWLDTWSVYSGCVWNTSCIEIVE